MFNRLSIQSKLVLMLLSVAILSILLLGWIGFRSGREALTSAINNQLVSIRSAKENLLKAELKTLKDTVQTLAESQTTVDAFKAFRDNFHELESRSIPADERENIERSVEAWYRDTFLTKLEQFVEGKPELSVYKPKSTVSQYLQYYYIVKNPFPYEKMQGLDIAEDGSGYSTVHQVYHPRIRAVAERYGWEDVHLIDPETLDIIYSYEKSTEFATNLVDGPYAYSNLGRLVQSVRKNMDRNDYRFADFEFYRPALNQPNAFVATPIFEGSRMIGILTVQFPIARINNLMTSAGQWEKEGLGKTGEVYLIGPDKVFRSRSRFMVQDKAALLKDLNRTGISETLLKRIDRAGMLIGYLQVNSESVQKAIEGQTFEGISNDYRNQRVLSTAAPIDVEGNRWAIVAEMDEAEAFAPVRKYAYRVLYTALGLLIGTTILASLLSNIFVGPIRKLAAGARLVAKGRTDVQVKLRSKDELGELATSFNSMTKKLQQKQEQLQVKVRENEELLLNILPGSVAARRMETSQDDRLAQKYSDLTVLFASIDGLMEQSTEATGADTLAILNDLVVIFDETADRFGVEKVKTAGTTYMAVCGLSIQRPDHTNRIVEFASELVKIIDRFNRERGTHLRLVAGINAGPVVGGLVGRNKFIYDLWGDTVSIAQELINQPEGISRILVTSTVHDRLMDLYSFDPAGEVVIRGRNPMTTYGLKI